MIAYRKPDEYYIDAYDRRTIKILKAVEATLTERLTPLKRKKLAREVLSIALLEHNSFNDTGARRDQNKRQSIQKEMEADEQLDRLVANTKAPKTPVCTTCNEKMQLCTHLFEEGDTELLFVFECPNHHAPRRAIYSDGRERATPNPNCSKCGGNVTTNKQETNKQIIITDTCERCGHVDTMPIERVNDDQPITLSDREKYITRFENGDTYMEAIIKLNKTFAEIWEEQKVKEVKELIGFDKIEKPTVHQLTQRIIEKGEANGFVSLQLDKPEISRDEVIISFTVQEGGDRKEKESVEAFQSFLNELLLPTNWRLQKKSVAYRLGYVSGKLQGYEHESDLMKIAEEIVEKKNRKHK